MNGNFTISSGVIFIMAIKRKIVIRPLADKDGPGIIVKDGHAQAFIDKVARVDPVGDLPKSGHLLWTNNQTREEVVDSNEDASQDLSCTWTSDQTHEKLTSVRVNGCVERKEAPKGNTFPYSNVQWRTGIIDNSTGG